MADLSFLVAIPVYNEQSYLRSVLGQVRDHVDEILVVDDGSTDQTPEILRDDPGLHLIRHRQNAGYGKSLADAFGYAVAGGYDWLITLDCDEQHEPAFIPKFMSAARAGSADLISGSRYLEAYSENTEPPADRRWINARVSEILNQRLGLAITDAFCGFKAYRVSALKGVCITEPGYAMPLQFWVQAVRLALRVTELPVRLIYKDPTRHFGGELDDPGTRYDHYLSVLEAELIRQGFADEPAALCGSVRAAC